MTRDEMVSRLACILTEYDLKDQVHGLEPWVADNIASVLAALSRPAPPDDLVANLASIAGADALRRRPVPTGVEDEGDGVIGIDFDRANDCVVSVTLYPDGTWSWSAKVGSDSGYGRGTPMPQWVRDANSLGGTGGPRVMNELIGRLESGAPVTLDDALAAGRALREFQIALVALRLVLKCAERACDADNLDAATDYVREALRHIDKPALTIDSPEERRKLASAREGRE